MVRYSLTDCGRKEGQPLEFIVYNLQELAEMLITNSHLINLFDRRRQNGHRLHFILIRLHNLDVAKTIFAALIREVFEEDVNFATYRPSQRLMYIYYGNKLNWIPDVKKQIVETAQKIMRSNRLHHEKDKWGESLVSGGGKVYGS